jgi:hypothetical protein
MVRQLAQSSWVHDHLNVLITGATEQVTLCTTLSSC